MNALDKAIRDNFPGTSNAGLRAELRKADGDAHTLMMIGKRVALTAGGKASLQAVIAAAKSLATA